jgi:hypothetical protein
MKERGTTGNASRLAVPLVVEQAKPPGMTDSVAGAVTRGSWRCVQASVVASVRPVQGGESGGTADRLELHGRAVEEFVLLLHNCTLPALTAWGAALAASSNDLYP